ncbi:MAG: phosphate ABC transporter permease subunit PstC [Deltaproteobacteria bacterium]|nr:phosphate ABC transporter permease subunit PstC [Deltaproteobacteria bacterium]
MIKVSFDSIFKTVLKAVGVLMLLLLAGIFVTLVIDSLPAMKAAGFAFFTGTTWDPVFKEYGSLVFLVGTLLTSFLALAISLPFSLAIAIFLGEYFRSGLVSSFLKSAIELMAGIPSVIFGMWGLFVLVPLVRQVEMQFGVAPYGIGILTASLILAVMIIPYSASISSDVVNLVPADLKEAALSLGATRYEMIKKVVLPSARSGIFAGVLLSLGRAIGETMAVTMVIGNANILPTSIFSPANTMASIIANEFAEATDAVYISCLIEVGLLLMMVTLVISMIGRYIMHRMKI